MDALNEDEIPVPISVPRYVEEAIKPSARLPKGCKLFEGVLVAMDRSNLPLPLQGFYNVEVHPRYNPFGYTNYRVREVTPNEVLALLVTLRELEQDVTKHLTTEARMAKSFISWYQELISLI